MKASKAIVASAMERSGEPRTAKVPPDSSRSSSATSSWWAAMVRALARTRSAARKTAVPPTLTDRDPYVSIPCGATAVSECSTSTSSGLIPSLSATIIDQLVTCPWPWGEVPVTT